MSEAVTPPEQTSMMAPSMEAPSTAELPPFVEVAIPVPLRQLFTYRWPEAFGPVEPGTRVAVPFSGRKLVGVVMGGRATPPEGVRRIAKVAGRIEASPVFDAELLRFLVEAADYYVHPIGEVLRVAAPALPREATKNLRADGFLEADEALPGAAVATKKALFLKPTGREPQKALGSSQQLIHALVTERGEVSMDELRARVKSPRAVVRRLEERGLLEVEVREVPADRFFVDAIERDTPPEPNADQAAAIETLLGRLRGLEPGGVGATHLLHGVTGSGKTEVYLRVIDEARAAGRGALLLVPEIALTPQLVSRFRARFGDDIAVLHSGLGEVQRAAAWRGLRRGELRLAVGARSALFAPIANLGVLVVDEEHDPSFKQEEGFRYHARDLAILRAHRAGALCILGSATPSLESFYRASEGHYGLSTLPQRATSHELPDVEIVDLKRNGAGPSGHPLISGPLHRALEKCLADEGQAILFLNRRGFTPTLRCEACGELVTCPACSVSLTEHRRAGALRCHYCDFSMAIVSKCPSCQAPKLAELGLGTERLEDTLSEAFYPARVARLDRDTAAGGRAIESVLNRVRAGQIDILVGTQMVTKGHDLPGVTLVGVILADQSLAFPDYRAAERTFSLVSQVAGRAGRGEKRGRVVVQTFQPENAAIAAATRHDYAGFYAREIEDRRALGYAPFGRLVAVRLDAGEESRGRRAIDALAEHARAHRAVKSGPVELLGPTAAPIARLRGRFRFRFMLRSPHRPALLSVARSLRAKIEQGIAPARAHVDVDPVSML